MNCTLRAFSARPELVPDRPPRALPKATSAFADNWAPQREHDHAGSETISARRCRRAETLVRNDSAFCYLLTSVCA